jgi:O-methyltransferase
MDNFFIIDYFDWRPKRRSVVDRFVNRCLRKAGIPMQLATAAAFDALINRLRSRSGVAVEPLAAIFSGSMTNVEQRMNMFHLIDQVLAYGVVGDVVELGCYQGRSAALFGRVMMGHKPERKLHLYDSFAGLPGGDLSDGKIFKAGGLSTSEEVVRTNFRRYGLPEPVIHKGWFNETLPDALPERIAFAHLDGDFYESIKVSLEHVYPRLSCGAICLLDDYNDPAVNPAGWNLLPGVKKACDEFFVDKPEQVVPIYSGGYSHAFFRKL